MPPNGAPEQRGEVAFFNVGSEVEVMSGWRRALSSIDSSALLITGTLSPMNLQSKIEDLAGILPNVEALVTVRRGGHGMNTSRPGKLAEAITAFADGVVV